MKLRKSDHKSKIVNSALDSELRFGINNKIAHLGHDRLSRA